MQPPLNMTSKGDMTTLGRASFFEQFGNEALRHLVKCKIYTRVEFHDIDHLAGLLYDLLHHRAHLESPVSSDDRRLGQSLCILLEKFSHLGLTLLMLLSFHN